MRWLTLLTSLPPTPTRHRVGVGRKLQRMGAVRIRVDSAREPGNDGAVSVAGPGDLYTVLKQRRQPMQPESFAAHWREIAAHFLKLGFTAYGGPAIMGIMQTEIQERRRWVL